MALTINGSGPWKYLDLVNECIRILLTIALGSASSGLGIFDVKTFVPVATRFVFYVALPLLVVRGLGVGIDFYDDSFSWTFIGVFLILRVIALCFAIGCAWLQGEGIGQLTVIWLGLSWISTVILGIPIANAVFGSPQLGVSYGLVRIIMLENYEHSQ
jgi:predicted permease